MSNTKEKIIEYEYQLYANEYMAKQGLWVTGVRIENMSTNHIQNCISLINEKRIFLLDCYIPIFEHELQKRGDEK